MKYRDKTKAHHLKELEALRRRVTQLEKSQAELKQAEKELRIKESAILSSINGIAICDFEGNLTYVNPSFIKLWGYDDKKEVLGKPTLEFWEAEEKAMEVIKALLDKGSWIGELVARRKNGSLFDAQLLASLITDDSGKPICMMSSFVDITERKKAEEALKVSEEQYRDLVEKAGIGILIDDKDGNFKYVNKTYAELFGYSEEEMKQQSIQSIVHPDDVGRVMDFHKRRIQGKKAPPRYEFRGIRKDGSVIYVEVDAVELREGEEIIGSRSYLWDITERKKAEERIRASLKEKEILLREVHHRVKNNMQVISSLFNLQARDIKDKKSAEIFKSCQNRVRAMALVHERLYQATDLAKVNIEEYVQGLIGHLLSSYGTNAEAIRLKIDIRDIFLDISKAIPCGLIINELVSNSLKHAFLDRKKGEIRISMKFLNEDEVELAVSDDGIGLPRDVDLRKIESLGLHLVTILAADQLHGSIELDRSEGTKFVIRFRKRT